MSFFFLIIPFHAHDIIKRSHLHCWIFVAVFFFFSISFNTIEQLDFWWNADASNLVYLFDFVLCIRSILRFYICTGKLDDWHQKRNKAVIDCVNNSCSFFSFISRSSLIFTRFPVQNGNTVYFARSFFFFFCWNEIIEFCAVKWTCEGICKIKRAPCTLYKHIMFFTHINATISSQKSSVWKNVLILLRFTLKWNRVDLIELEIVWLKLKKIT